LEAAGLIKRNVDTEEILICNFFEVNRPSNDRARIAVAKQIDAVECEHLRNEAETALQAVIPSTKAATENRPAPWAVNEKGSLLRNGNGR